MGDTRITAVESFVTQPNRQRLIVVRVRTNQDGLYGLGCATFTQRHLAVKAAIDGHVGPLVVGRDPNDIEDIFQVGMVNGYWRNGPVLNNAVSGVDMALWDIKGKLAGMPCYQLWGGRCRPAADVYVHANGREPAEVAERAHAFIERGFRYVRCQLGGYSGPGDADVRPPEGAHEGAYFDAREKLRRIPSLFEFLRSELGEQVELLYDVHERLAPIDAVWLAKALEPCRLFFLEDVLAPEELDWLENIRAVCATPIAMGELFNNPREMVPIRPPPVRLHPRAHIAGRRHHAGAQTGAPVRGVRRADGLARAGRRLAGRHGGQRPPRRGAAQLRRAGMGVPHGRRTRDIPRHTGGEKRRRLAERASRPGHRVRRGGGREVPSR